MKILWIILLVLAAGVFVAAEGVGAWVALAVVVYTAIRVAVEFLNGEPAIPRGRLKI